jgi:hypothetical protein
VLELLQCDTQFRLQFAPVGCTDQYPIALRATLLGQLISFLFSRMQAIDQFQAKLRAALGMRA